MNKDHGFIIMSRSVFLSETWLNATLEQRGAMADLWSRAVRKEYDRNCKFGQVHLEKGQLVTSMHDLAIMWNLGERGKGKAQKIVNHLASAGFLTVQVVYGNTKRETGRKKGLYSILTVNDIHDSADLEADRCPGHMNINNINNNIKNIPPKKSPQGGVSSKDSFVKEKKGRTSMVTARYDRLRQTWNKIFSDGRCSQDYLKFMPERWKELCGDQSRINRIKCQSEPPFLRDTDPVWVRHFFELHVYYFTVNSGLMNRMRTSELDELARELMERSHDLNFAQMALFFHFLRIGDKAVGPPRWNSLLSSVLVNEAFTKYLAWLQN